MVSISKDLVNYLHISPDDAGQRLDNYLFKVLKGVPKGHIHKLIRKGEIRVNKKRAQPEQHTMAEDVIRIPPIRVAQKKDLKAIPAKNFPIIYEDDVLLVINKPSGVAVHGGSGLQFGVIEQIRQARPDARYLELVHRLDKDTSGLLMIAKKRSALTRLHEQLRQNHPDKIYLALTYGQNWPSDVRHVKYPLIKYTGQNGEKMVRVDDNGQYAHSIFDTIEDFELASLVRVTLKTGRTHQIRVHMQATHCPIALDERYGNYDVNRKLKKIGLKRMFLHAHQLTITHPATQEKLTLTAPLPEALNTFLETLRDKTHEHTL